MCLLSACPFLSYSASIGIWCIAAVFNLFQLRNLCHPFSLCMLDPNVKQSLFVEQPRRISAWCQDEYRSVPFSLSQVLICSTAQFTEGKKMHHEILFIEKKKSQNLCLKARTMFLLLSLRKACYFTCLQRRSVCHLQQLSLFNPQQNMPRLNDRLKLCSNTNISWPFILISPALNISD